MIVNCGYDSVAGITFCCRSISIMLLNRQLVRITQIERELRVVLDADKTSWVLYYCPFCGAKNEIRKEY